MRFLTLILVLFILAPSIYTETGIQTISFLDSINTKYNGAGPLMVKVDRDRDRVVLINTNTSSVTLINGKDDGITNIPISKRVPQYLKEESFVIDRKTGNIYLIGSGNLTIVFPDTGTALTFDTKYQYEMVAVDENTGNCFLAGRESRKVAFVHLKKGRLKYIRVFDRKEKMVNLNQTPPPPIRKIIADPALGTVSVFDGYSNRLFTLDIGTGKVKGSRVPDIKPGKRFHFAGYDKEKHCLYLVTETEKRKVIEAVKLDCRLTNDTIIKLPGLSEGVGISLNAEREEVYIPYDNHPVVHIVNFKGEGKVHKADIPSYGNDASAFNNEKSLLYVASWAYGEIYIVDLATYKLKKRIRGTGIIPHMFSMAFNPAQKKLYIPLGASAVNGSFGSAVTCFNTDTWEKKKIVTGWAPVDLIEMKKKDGFLVFNTESEFAEVTPDGKVTYHQLPFPYPAFAARKPNGNIFLSYGPHQSYWPAVYIWGAKNGILEIEEENLQMFDRRIPRLAHKIVFDKRGGLYGLQNSWGRENLFLTWFPKGIRMFAPQERVYFYTKIQRENIQRILKYDEGADLLYIVKVAETDPGPGSLLIINAEDNRLVKEVPTGNTPTDLCFDKNNLYVSNFDSGTITQIDKKSFNIKSLKTGKGPLKVISHEGELFVLNHLDNDIQVIGKQGRRIPIPHGLSPDNMVRFGSMIYVTAHNENSMGIFKKDLEGNTLIRLHQFSFPYGETTFDNTNTAFYLRGQFGDSIYELSQIKKGKDGKLWVTDLLSGRLFIISI